MSASRLRTLPAAVLAALFVAAAGQLSARAQGEAQLASAPRDAASSPRLTDAAREFFSLSQTTGAWERELPAPSGEGCSCIMTIDPSKLDDGVIPVDISRAVRAQQPPPPPTQVTTLRAPLTPGQKMRRAFRGAFLSRAGYVRTAISATITEATEEDLPHKQTDDRVADGFSRFAIKFGTRATRTLLGSGVYPIIFKQDPRYERSTSKNLARRALHAAARVFVTRGDNGRLQPNYSRFAGAFSASALSNLWEQSTPGRDRIGWDATGRRFLSSFPDDMLNNILFREFLPDIIKIFRRR